jgi:hypothetical protein
MPDIPYADAASLRQSERNHYGQYVTAERQKWRDRMREIVVDVSKLAMNSNMLDDQALTDLYAIRAEMTVRLNMTDNSDRLIVQRLTQVIGAKSANDRRMHVEAFEEFVSLLLKDDWERVKNETRPIWQILKPVKRVDRLSKRVVSEQSGVWIVVNTLFVVLFLMAAVWSVTVAYRHAESIFEKTPVVVDQKTSSCSSDQQQAASNAQVNKSKTTALDPLSIQLPPLEGIDQQLL